MDLLKCFYLVNMLRFCLSLLSKGDSGGLLVCRREDGVWVLAGITCWGVSCVRGWNPLRNKQRRTSPGIFSKVSALMDFIIQIMVTGGCNFY